MKYTKRFLSLGIVFLLMFSLLVVPASANSAQTQWEGVDSAGAIVRDGGSPIIVEKELLTFDIQEFPDNYYSDLDSYLAYSGKVTAEYTFFNPADYTVTATLLFPFGCEPTYAIYEYYGKDTEKYDILIDGQPVEKVMRYTLSTGFDQFELKTDLALLHDDYVTDSFYSLDLPVTKYVFMPSGVDTETYGAADAGFDMVRDDPERRIYYVDQNGLHTQDDGDLRVHSGVENGEAITVYVIGQDYAEFPQWKFYQNGGVEDGEEINGTMTLESREELSFRDLALSKWSADSGVSEIDWYNAVVAMLTGSSDSTGSNLHLWDYGSLDLSRYLMRWYEYEISVGPGERIVNTVTAPIYPSINARYEPPIYEFTYLLSPAKTWAEFGNLDIVVNTPYYMITDGEVIAFEQTDSGYSVHLTGLPEGELTFTLCSEATTKIPVLSSGGFSADILLLGAAVLMAVAVIIVFARAAKKKRMK